MRSRKPRLSSPAIVTARVREFASPKSRGGPPPSGDADLGPFRRECDAAISVLRQALLELSEAAGIDPLRPQDVSRRLGLNKNLTWKIAKVLGGRDSLEALSVMPGSEGIDIYLRAFESAGVDATPIRSAREAFASIDDVIARHFGDRGQLELVLDGARADGNLEQSRRLAFRGMSGVFGLQAKVRLAANIISPSTEKGKTDISLIVGLVGLQRLRPQTRLPVFRWAAGGASDRLRPSPLFPGEHESDFLVREFSSFSEATVVSSSKDGVHVTELVDGPLGRIGESDLFFSSVARNALPVRRSEEDVDCELVTIVSIPAEGLVSDLFVHKSIEGLETLESSLHSTLARPLSNQPSERASSRLPVDVAPLLIEDPHRGFGVLAVPRYEELIGQAFARLGQDLRDYRLIRVALAFPPAPAALLVRWDLPE